MRLLPDWWGPVHTEACVLLAVTFVAGFGAAILGALVDRRLSPRCSACSGC